MRPESFLGYWLRTSAAAQVALMLLFVLPLMVVCGVTLLDWLDGRPASLPAAIAAFAATLDGGALACR